jgi:ubiquinone/menaquinone biosynthesis C-methylase UbiE
MVAQAPHRDVDAFDERAPGYESGWLGRLHHEISDRTADLALKTAPSPRRVLDVGCGTGYLLRLLAERCPDAISLTGIDAAPSMIAVAESGGAESGGAESTGAESAGAESSDAAASAAVSTAASTASTAGTEPASDPRLDFRLGLAEHLPFPDGAFDLVVSTTSFDHWNDQGAGLAECARVLEPGGALVLVDQFSAWLAPTLVAGRRGKARTKRRATGLLTAAGFQEPRWHDLYAVIIKAVTATVPTDATTPA